VKRGRSGLNLRAEGILQSIPNSSVSIDPALSASAHFAETLSLNQLIINANDVYIFDYDGVIASRMDDDIYKLTPTVDELILLSTAAECFGIHCDGMEQRYQRHLIYQAAAWCLQLPIEAGPAFSQAIDSGRRAQLFIVTARSGWHAVERLRKHVRSSDIRPVEIYNVGRVKKDRQIELICREFQSKQIFFIEDSTAHLADAAAIGVDNLRLVGVTSNLQPERDSVDLRRHFIETVESAILIFRRAEPPHDQYRS
jgi:hypothetical protein